MSFPNFLSLKRTFLFSLKILFCICQNNKKLVIVKMFFFVENIFFINRFSQYNSNRCTNRRCGIYNVTLTPWNFSEIQKYPKIGDPHWNGPPTQILVTIQYTPWIFNPFASISVGSSLPNAFYLFSLPSFGSMIIYNSFVVKNIISQKNLQYFISQI